MLTHLIILLDDTSVSYCHYDVPKNVSSLIDLGILKAGIVFAMKENLNIQFVYPDYALPKEYNSAIESIDHIKIKPEKQADEADVIVLKDWKEYVTENIENSTCIIRANRKELYDSKGQICDLLNHVSRLNVVLTDTMDFVDSEIDVYNNWLNDIVEVIAGLYNAGKNVQFNLLTDRFMLTEMNNCNAGVNNITLAPNGKFYLCPAFYYEDPQNSIGDLKCGLEIKNQQLLRLDHAPICRNCDAYQCKRCIWMNKQLTLDLNTPSHQQCVIAHLERNATRELLLRFEKRGIKVENCETIEELTELDPFNIVNKWK